MSTPTVHERTTRRTSLVATKPQETWEEGVERTLRLFPFKGHVTGAWGTLPKKPGEPWFPPDMEQQHQHWRRWYNMAMELQVLLGLLFGLIPWVALALAMLTRSPIIIGIVGIVSHIAAVAAAAHYVPGILERRQNKKHDALPRTTIGLAPFCMAYGFYSTMIGVAGLIPFSLLF